MANTDITPEDIRLWIDKFQTASEILERCTEQNNGDKKYIQQALSDALFLVAFAESKLKVKVSDDVYNRARALQEDLCVNKPQTNCERCAEYGSYKCTRCDGELYFKDKPQTEKSQTDCAWK